MLISCSLTRSGCCSSGVFWVSSAAEIHPVFWSHYRTDQWCRTDRVWRPDSPAQGSYSLQTHERGLLSAVRPMEERFTHECCCSTHRAGRALCPARRSCTAPPARSALPSASPSQLRGTTRSDQRERCQSKTLSQTSDSHTRAAAERKRLFCSSRNKRHVCEKTPAPPGGREEMRCSAPV